MVTKTGIYFAKRKTASAHVYLKKAEKGREGGRKSRRRLVGGRYGHDCSWTWLSGGIALH